MANILWFCGQGEIVGFIQLLRILKQAENSEFGMRNSLVPSSETLLVNEIQEINMVADEWTLSKEEETTKDMIVKNSERIILSEEMGWREK